MSNENRIVQHHFVTRKKSLMFGPTLQTIRISGHKKILDAETRHCTTVCFRGKIESSLHRHQLDDFLNHQDIAELRYIADLWTRLFHSATSYTIGCNFVKRDIITILLELYKLRQIAEVCLKL